MGRCPYYLEMDGFDKLAKAVNVKVSREGIEALAEICEMFGEMLLKNAKNSKYLKIGSKELRKELKKLGFNVVKSNKKDRIFERMIKD